MTLRELLKMLQALDEKSLDMYVFVSPPSPVPSDRFEGISRVSVMDEGHAVIHLTEPEDWPGLKEMREAHIVALGNWARARKTHPDADPDPTSGLVIFGPPPRR
jgi:hypothetical protein